MKREIKFRAWDKNSGMFDCEIISLGTGYETWRDFEDGSPSSDILMQYTGLKDKNGKEIYEGDIVIEKKYNIHKGFCEVFWNVDRFDLTNYNNGDYYHGYEVNWTEVEVIGNIYENKELLEK